MDLIDILMADAIISKKLPPAILNLKGSVATTSELPLSGNAKGDVWVVTADNSEWVWMSDSSSGTFSDYDDFGVVVDLSPYRTAADQDIIDGNKQAKVTASGILKGDGNGGITAAVEGTDYGVVPAVTSEDDGKFAVVIGGKWDKLDAFIGEMDLATFNRYIVAGLGPSAGPVGTSLVCEKTVDDVTEQIPMNVLDYDYHTPADPHIQHSCTIGMTKCYQNLAFDAPEALIKVVDGLAGGSHFFIKLDHGAYGGGTGQDGTYGGTLAADQTIPAGGYLRHTAMGVYQSSYNTAQITGGKWIAYDASFNQIGAQIDTDSDDETGTDFGTATAQTANGNSPHVNFTSRNAYGDNRLEYSNWLQFANASGTGWWVQKTEFDFPPSGISTLKGLLTGLDPVMLKSMMKVKIRVAIPTCDGGGYKDIETKVFPLSMTEVNLGTNNSQYETSFGLDNTLKTTPLAFYTGATNADRIKTLNGAARFWWLRSPYPSLSGVVRFIGTDGSLTSDNAYYARGLSAAWVIGNPYIA